MTTQLINHVAMMPPGSPGHDLGVAHVLKHWLNPGEYWDDLAIALLPNAPDLHPALVADALQLAGAPAPHTVAPDAPDVPIIAAWERLSWVHRFGYGAVVETCFSTTTPIFAHALSAPPPPPRLAHRTRSGRFAIALPGGIIAIGDIRSSSTSPKDSSMPQSTTESPTTLMLRTAYRITLARNTRFDHGPRDPANRAIRIGLSELRAQDHVALLASGATP